MIERMVVRREALAQCGLLDSSDCRALFVTAQAGQGKTVLVSQFEEMSSRYFVWTTCTEADLDPYGFFEKIVWQLDSAIPTFNGAEVLAPLQQMLLPNEFVEMAAERLAVELALSNLQLTLVFDDAHLLQESELCVQLLWQIVAQSPPSVKSTIVSRYSLRPSIEGDLQSGQYLEVDASILAFSREEIAELYNEVLEVPTGTERINNLLKATEGWVAGLMLLHKNSGLERLVGVDKDADLGDFFHDLVCSGMQPEDRAVLFLLSLLTEIPHGLLAKLGEERIAHHLDDMVSRNLFLRVKMEGGEAVYRFHHLLQESFAARAKEEIAEVRRAEFLKSAGLFFVERGRLDEGVRCLSAAEAWSDVEDVMRRSCIKLFVQNHHFTIIKLLGGVPESVKARSAWLTFCYAGALMGQNPGEAQMGLLRSLDMFTKANNEVGELFALCSLLNFQILIDGNFGRKARYVIRGVELFDKVQGQMSAEEVLFTAQALTLGKVYYQSELDEARRFLGVAQSAQRRMADKVEPWLVISEALIWGMMGNLDRSFDILDQLYSEISSPWFGPTLRFSILLVRMNYLEMKGDAANFHAVKREIEQECPDLMEQSYLAPFSIIWELDLLVKDGRYEDALELARESLKKPPLQNPHLKCQVIYYYVLASAFLGNVDEVEQNYRDALRIRASSGGPFFVHLTHCMVGAALSLVGQNAVAERIFRKCEKWEQRYTPPYHAPLVYSYRAAMYLRQGDAEAAKADVFQVLKRMRQFKNKHFFAWSPDIMAPLLAFAVKEGIEPSYARHLAREQLGMNFLDDGTQIPLLQVKIVGGLELAVGEARIDSSDLTSAWRRVLSLLAVAPKQTLPNEKIQRALWPDEEPEDSRGKYDTMLSRLRSKLASILGKETTGRYFLLKGQQLQLQHCVVDCNQIVSLAREGVALVEKTQDWQAHHVFVLMAQCIGPMFEDSASALALPPQIADSVARALIVWVGVLERGAKLEYALRVVDRGLSLMPINDTMQRQRYNLLASLNRPGEASLSLKQYRSALEKEGFSADELSLIIDGILAY
ncbi:hypothetical protein [Pseudodesulfovibrio sp. zrk46]|uniref:hypothetical protein n=1 Tax=Pseudodesulfovibrio sp. zrk46 TaxID=2725288 RepID=UPI0014491B6C|nr:hypothetical protein [Pseudodesulfovibrio sp. zrk46]QJB55315.1 hypothetical protein HFN16_02385 [Pseudodesulfovibrio sp. zrk46]